MSSHDDYITRDVEEHDIRLAAPVTEEQARVITPEALRFVAALAREFDTRRRALLGAREMRQHEIDNGHLPDFLDDTKHIRASKWTVVPPARDLIDRRVEMLGPPARDTMIEAIFSGANVFVADFEDSTAPTWQNVVDGQVNLTYAAEGTLAPPGDFTGRAAAIAVRPRGWHLDERHVLLEDKPVPGALFDFGVYFFNNVRTLLERQSAPYFYLPKLESRHEARLWNDVFSMAQDALGIPRGTIRATVLIETVHAAFEMDEILFELRHHSAGLGSGRWDYLFSFVKRFRHSSACVLPDRRSITTDGRFLKSCVELMIRTCHRRGTHALGGMSAQIPINADPMSNATAQRAVREQKLREVLMGHDGTLVAHPGLVAVAKEVFDGHMQAANQIDRTLPAVSIRAKDLLRVPDGDITEAGLRDNIRVAIIYVESWLRGNGCVVIHDRVEDAAAAEISRSQVWQWLRHRAKLADGRVVDNTLVEQAIADEVNGIRENIEAAHDASHRFDDATEIVRTMITGSDFPEFIPLVATPHLDPV